MTSIRILHVSDLHYSSKPIAYLKPADQKIVLQSFFRDISEYVSKQEKSVDLIVFSGDLVFSGTDRTEFELALKEFVSPLCQGLGLSIDNFYCAPGNHDLSQKAIIDYIENGLTQQLQNVDATNSIIEAAVKSPEIHSNLLERFSNFHHFEDTIKSKGLLSKNLFGRTYGVEIGGIKIGIACLNSAWRSSGKGSVEKGKLILGERILDYAAEDLAGYDLKIAILHHPTSWLTEFDQVAVDNRLQSDFSIILFGHAHRSKPEFISSPLGHCVSLQAGTLYQSRQYLNGYQIIDIDVESETIAVEIRAYFDDPSRKFARAVGIGEDGFINFNLPREIGTENLRSVKRFLSSARRAIRNQAKKAIVLPIDLGSDTIDLNTYYICPPLSDKRESDLVARTSIHRGKTTLTVDAILTSSENFAIVGTGQSGKTSLAHYMAMKVSEGLADRPRIPAVLKWAPNISGGYWLRRQLKQYYVDVDESLPVDSLLKEGAFFFLVDDFTTFDEATYRRLSKDLGTEAGNRVVVFARDTESNFSAINDPKSVLPDIQRVFIHTLPRKSIRALANSRPNLPSAESSPYDLVITQIERTRLPRTGYIVSLILAAMRSNRPIETPNEALLLENLVDLLLNKARPEGQKLNTFNFQSNIVLLQQIAMDLKGKPEGTSQNDLCKLTLSFLAEKGVEANATEVVTSLLSSGLFDYSEQSVSFRYPCFQEYFIATKLRDDPAFLDHIAASGDLLRYRREVELYAGLNLQNPKLLEILDQLIRSNVPIEISAVTTNWTHPIQLASSLLDESKEPLLSDKEPERTQEDLDNMLDDIDRQAIQLTKLKGAETSEADGVKIPIEFVASLDLCARCLRNLEFVDRGPKVRTLLEILNLWARFLFVYVSECDRLLKDPDRQAELSKVAPGKEKLVEHLVRIILPIAFTSVISEQLGSSHIAKLLDDAGKSETEPGHDLYKDLGTQVLCAFLLLESRSPGAIAHIRQIIRNNPNNTFLLLLLIEKLRLFYTMNYLTSAEKKEIRDLIVDGYRTPTSAPKHKTTHIQRTVDSQLSKIDFKRSKEN